MRKREIVSLAAAALVAGRLAFPATAQTPGTPAQPAAPAKADLIKVVAAENFYGELATQIGGPHVRVVSILTRPDQDPHVFEASPSVARALSEARIVIQNGADYDPWMTKLLKSAKSARRHMVVVADLIGKKAGDNPHLWYDPSTMPAAARAITAALTQTDPTHEAEYAQALQAWLCGLQPFDTEVSRMKQRHAGAEIAATEPVFGYMAAALGLIMRNDRFQLAVMNGTEPRASDIAAFEADLRNRKVRALIYNSQVSNGASQRLVKLAEASGVPLVPVSETEPAGKSYAGWMLEQLGRLDAALARSTP